MHPVQSVSRKTLLTGLISHTLHLKAELLSLHLPEQRITAIICHDMESISRRHQAYHRTGNRLRYKYSIFHPLHDYFIISHYPDLNILP